MTRVFQPDHVTRVTALVTIDSGAVPDALWRAVTTQIEKGAEDSDRHYFADGHAHAQCRRSASPDYVQKIMASFGK
jgi:hypothetical protein